LMRMVTAQDKPKSRLQTDAPRMQVRTLPPGREFNDVDYRCEECGALRAARGRSGPN
jgi:hypothetical protein